MPIPKKLTTFSKRGNTFMTRFGRTYVLCSDSTFRPIDMDAFEEREEVIVDLNALPYKEDIHKSMIV